MSHFSFRAVSFAVTVTLLSHLCCALSELPQTDDFPAPVQPQQQKQQQQKQQHKRMHFKFIWLMQGKEAMDLSFLRSDRSDAIQVAHPPSPPPFANCRHFGKDRSTTMGRVSAIRRVKTTTAMHKLLLSPQPLQPSIAPRRLPPLLRGVYPLRATH